MKEISQTSNVVEKHRFLDWFKRVFLEEDIPEQEGEDTTVESFFSDTRFSNQDKKALEEGAKEVKKMESMQEEKRSQEGSKKAESEKRKNIAMQHAETKINPAQKTSEQDKTKGKSPKHNEEREL